MFPVSREDVIFPCQFSASPTTLDVALGKKCRKNGKMCLHRVFGFFPLEPEEERVSWKPDNRVSERRPAKNSLSARLFFDVARKILNITWKVMFGSIRKECVRIGTIILIQLVRAIEVQPLWYRRERRRVKIIRVPRKDKEHSQIIEERGYGSILFLDT